MFLAPKKLSEVDDVMVGVNHSCSPNVGICGQIDTTAMRDIEPGEEITGDYAVAYQNDHFNFVCNCGSHDCRKRVTSGDWMNIVLQNKYRGYLSKYITNGVVNR